MKAVEKSHYESDSYGFSDPLDERQEAARTEEE